MLISQVDSLLNHKGTETLGRCSLLVNQLYITMAKAGQQ